MLSQVIGHDRIKQQLERDIESRQLHHAYLFSGPEHVGKMSLLQEFVSRVRDNKPFANNPLLAQQIAVGQGPGLISFLDDGESLKVEQARTVADFVSRRTAENEFSFCIIEHIERMTRAASNAFLKVLEEPSPRFIFLMTSRQERKLLPTVISRVQLFRFSVLPEKQVRNFLEAKVENPLQVKELMTLSIGRPGLAMSMLHDKELLERMRNLYDYAQVFLDHNLVEKFSLAEHLTKKDVNPRDLQNFLMYLALRLRQEGSGRWVPQLDRIQKLQRLFQDTQVNKRMFLEEMFLNIDNQPLTTDNRQYKIDNGRRTE